MKPGYAFVILGVVGLMAFGANAQAQITLSFDTLPSAQGWTYHDGAGGIYEGAVFSVDGIVLHQNSINFQYGWSSYTLADVVDPTLPFTVSITARVQQQQGNPAVPCGFSFLVEAYPEAYKVCIGTNSFRIQTDYFTTTIDNTVYHDYRLQVVPPVYEFFVDDVLVKTGFSYTPPVRNLLHLGDTTGAAYARADLKAYTFDQVGPAVSGLIEDVFDLNLQTGIANSLDAKLDNALRALDDVNENNDVAAVNSLQAFINAVEAQRGNKISEADADDLIAAAQAIIDYLMQ